MSPASAFDRKPDLAEVDADQRHVDLGHGRRRPQERAVATEHDEDVGRRQLLDERVRVAGRAAPIRRCRGPGTSPRRAS